MPPSNPEPTSPTKRKTRAVFSSSANSSSWIKGKVDTSYLQTRTFGRPNRPSTPIYGVITNQYQRDFEDAQAKLAKRRVKVDTKKVEGKDVRAQHTLASLGHMKVERVEDKERFVMGRFDGVEKKIVTRWEQMPGRRGDKKVEEEKEQISQPAPTRTHA